MLTKIISLLFVVLVSFAQPVFAAEETNETLMPKGMWKDPATGLIWDRCSVGQKWDGTTCTGEAQSYTWNDALAIAKQQTTGGNSDWQLPTTSQLHSIRHCNIGGFSTGTEDIPDDTGGEFVVTQGCDKVQSKPAISLAIFPETLADTYWSASPDASGSDYAWGVGFNDGISNVNFKGLNDYVRAVRSGQSLGREAFEEVFKSQLANAEAVIQQPVDIAGKESLKDIQGMLNTSSNVADVMAVAKGASMAAKFSVVLTLVVFIAAVIASFIWLRRKCSAVVVGRSAVVVEYFALIGVLSVIVSAFTNAADAFFLAAPILGVLGALLLLVTKSVTKGDKMYFLLCWAVWVTVALILARFAAEFAVQQLGVINFYGDQGDLTEGIDTLLAIGSLTGGSLALVGLIISLFTKKHRLFFALVLVLLILCYTVLKSIA